MSSRDARRVYNALLGACLRALRRQDSIAIAVSGGLDSSILAAIISQHADIRVQLVNVSVPGAVDAFRARLLAEHLHRPLLEVVLNSSRLAELLPDLVALVGESTVEPALAAEWGVPPETKYVSPIQTAWETPIFVAARETRKFAKRLVAGQGADEWFGGYARYEGLEGDALVAALDRDRDVVEKEVRPMEERIARHHGVQIVYPYLDAGVRGVARHLPSEALVQGTERKRVLRDVARIVGLPEAIATVPKTAAQYGSGVAPLLGELAKKAGKPQNRFLTDLLHQRKMGEPHSLRM